jgi:very-short-patch-repair endonuclease
MRGYGLPHPVSLPLKGEGRGGVAPHWKVARADDAVERGFGEGLDSRKKGAGAPPLQGEGVGVGESRMTRQPGWRPDPRAKAFARTLRRAQTEAEKELWWHLRRKIAVEGTHFRRQVPIGPYVADFCCHGHRLIVELDGAQHGEDAGQAQDARRDAYLAAHGYGVLRFWNAQVFQEIEGVMEAITAALMEGKAEPARLSPTPDPSPGRGGARGARGERAAP